MRIISCVTILETNEYLVQKDDHISHWSLLLGHWKNSNRHYILYIISQIDFNLTENMSLWLKVYFRLSVKPLSE